MSGIRPIAAQCEQNAPVRCEPPSRRRRRRQNLRGRNQRLLANRCVTRCLLPHRDGGRHGHRPRCRPPRRRATSFRCREASRHAGPRNLRHDRRAKRQYLINKSEFTYAILVNSRSIGRYRRSRAMALTRSSEALGPTCSTSRPEFSSRTTIRSCASSPAFICPRRPPTIETVPDGAAALTLLRRGAFDIAMLDIEMPSLDGFSVAGKDPRRAALCHLPVMMLTGHEDIASIDRAFSLGANAFVTKPVNWRLLSYHDPLCVADQPRPARAEKGAPSGRDKGSRVQSRAPGIRS